jgi:hypothetical protein
VESVGSVESIREDADRPPAPVVYRGGPVEFDRIVPASGNLAVASKQFWLGPARAGATVTFWADHDMIHLSIAGARVKTIRSHLSATDLATLAATGARPAGPSPLPPGQPGAARQQRCVPDQTGQRLTGHSVELTHSAPGEPAKKRAQRRRSSDTTKDPRQCPVSDHSQVIDRVGTGHHARYHRGDLRPSVRRGTPGTGRNPHPLLGNRG